MISSEWILFVVFILVVDLPNPKIEPRSPALQADSYCLSHEESPYSGVCVCACGLHCYSWAFSSCGQQELLSCASFLIAVASLDAEHGL